MAVGNGQGQAGAVSVIGRRTLLHGAVVALAMPLVATAQDDRRSPRRFAPPSTPMLYTRRLERSLVGGASLTVTRRFAVRFVLEADGFRVDGEQVDVTVEAPPQLATLAELERERVETGLFPLRLDPAGTIVGQSPTGVSAQLDAAVREVTAQIERGPHTPAERDEMPVLDGPPDVAAIMRAAELANMTIVGPPGPLPADCVVRA